VPFVSDPDYLNVDSRLKIWMIRFDDVATKYLENYLGWRRGLERWGEQITPCAVLQAA